MKSRLFSGAGQGQHLRFGPAHSHRALKVGPQSPLSAADPAVLRSRTDVYLVLQTRLVFEYPEVGGTDAKEVLRKGHYRGRDSKWSQKKIEQKYKTTERKVTQNMVHTRRWQTIGRGDY